MDKSLKTASFLMQTNSIEWFNGLFRNSNGYGVKKLNCVFFLIFFTQKIFSVISFLYDTDLVNRWR